MPTYLFLRYFLPVFVETVYCHRLLLLILLRVLLNLCRLSAVPPCRRRNSSLRTSATLYSLLSTRFFVSAPAGQYRRQLIIVPHSLYYLARPSAPQSNLHSARGTLELGQWRWSHAPLVPRSNTPSPRAGCLRPLEDSRRVFIVQINFSYLLVMLLFVVF